MKSTDKTVICIGDLHCGHYAGLTPPRWQGGEGAPGIELRKEMWKHYRSWAKKYSKKNPIVIVNGDMIDGRGEASRGTELLTSDRKSQLDMAIQCIAQFEPSKVICTYGTAYHTGKGEDFEAFVAEHFNAPISSHIFPEINGVVFDVKHHLGSSGIPHGRHTAIAKDRLWNLLWAEQNEQPKGDIFIRSHVHYHQYCGGPGWLAMTLPPLQAAATKYGGRRCSGTVDFGVVAFEISQNGTYTWEPHVIRLGGVKKETIKI